MCRPLLGSVLCVKFYKPEPWTVGGMSASPSLAEPGFREAKSPKKAGQANRVRAPENTSLSSQLFSAAGIKVRIGMLSSCYPETSGIGWVWKRTALNDALGALPRPLHLKWAL